MKHFLTKEQRAELKDIIEILGKGKTAQLLSETIKRTKPYVASSSGTQNQRRKKTTSVYDVDGTGYLTIDNLTESDMIKAQI